jgi:predicted ATPase/class 3 adenylate cyclase
MGSLPSGTVTFLFTDIEGSTRLAQEYPDEMPSLLARHHEILHQSIHLQDGYVFQIIGDAFCAAFHSANDALHAAVEAQRALHNEPWTPAPIKVRIGIHTGTAKLDEDGQYSGYATLASTQRIMSAGHGGQILLSGVTRELVRDTLPSNTELSDLGEKRLKDLLRPEHLYQLNSSGLPSIFPPLNTLDVFPNNLPTQLTTFIGREREIAEVKVELESYRLVTLTGSGGTGKTRLSLQVAADLLAKFDHGVWYIELAPLSDFELIPETILSTIGISEQSGKTPLEILQEYLHEKNTLLVLDNCEHLIEACARATNALLNAAPNLKILASSREALGVKGEASYPVPSLSLPDIKHLPVIEQLSQYEAVGLFLDRALLVAPHFVVDNVNAPFIVQICFRLDGIPLAIELAAARVKMLSIEQISKRLDDRFRLLTGGARTALPRQQTLRALIDWSYDLLSENERLLLLRLSVFMGSWTLEAAEEVCSDTDPSSVTGMQFGETDRRLLVTDILDLLTQLVNKSLVVVIEHSQSGEMRYRMLETIRQYAREKHLEGGRSESIRDKHLAYFVSLAEQAEPELYRSNQAFWFKKLDDELDNLRMAMEWALTSNVEAGLRIAAIPWRFWDSLSYERELGNWLSKLLERHEIADALHTQALAVYASCFFTQGNFPETIRIARQSLQMARTLSDKHLEAFSLSMLGVFILLQGNVGEGVPLLEQSLAIYRELGDKIGQANTLERLAYNNSNSEHTKGLQESLRLNRELGNLTGIAICLNLLSRITIWNGDFSSPASWLEEALSISRQIGNQEIEMYALGISGNLAYWQGNYPQASSYYQEEILLAEKTGYHYQNLWGRVHLAYTVLRQGDIQRAHSMFEDSIEHTREAGLTIALVFAIEGLASLNVHQNQLERAAKLFAWADAMRLQIGDLHPLVEQNSVERDLAVIHARIDDIECARLSAEGRSMTVEEAIILALEWIHK